MIKTSNLTFQFNDDNSFQFPDIECRPSGSLLILGPSGSGKSTLLHLLCGLLKPNSGHILIDDHDIVAFSEKEMDKLRAEKIALIMQNPIFFKSLNMYENLKFSTQFSKNQINVPDLNDLLSQLQIKEKLNSKITDLSNGELQRFALIRALLQNPSILLADEPTSALDDINAEEVISIFLNLARKHNTSLIIVSHDHRIKSKFAHQIQL